MNWITGFLLLGMISGLSGKEAAGICSGRIIDASTQKPIPGALVTVQGTIVKTQADGSYRISAENGNIGARAAGYLRTEFDSAACAAGNHDVKLTPFRPKALYLSVYGIGSRELRNDALNLIAKTELNALVIDVKGDRGLIPYPSSVALAVRAGANRVITVHDIHALVADLHARGLYLIARIVTFKDSPLALARPDLAVKTANNQIYSDREDIPWTDPANKQVWEYNIDIAVEAAKNGFDEIQFDYVRFPDAIGLAYCVPNTEENRLRAISGFFEEARARLAPYNVFLAADIFGYVSWNQNDTCIGQKLETIAPLVDYLSPMLYSSGFQFGIPGYREPVAHPYEIVHLSLENALRRTGLSGVHFRPWLQAFKDYAFDHRKFGEQEIRDQIRAAEEAGSDGWMLWNPRNVYSEDGLHKRH